MKILTVDFETYYSKTYSLSKMTTEEYIRSPEFEVIGVAVSVDDTEPRRFSGTLANTRNFLNQFDWENSVAVAHNAVFDMAILSWVFGIKPKRIADTLSMARAIHGTEVGGSLKALAEHYDLEAKGTEVLDALGKRRLDFTPEELKAYGEYCKKDVRITYKLFHHLMAEGFPVSELQLVDLTVRMFTEPTLVVDSPLLESHLVEVKNKKEALLSRAMVDKEDLMSNAKFADLLVVCNAVPPTKISPATGKEAYAFAKTDEEFVALQEHPNILVQSLVAARLGTKSTLEEARTQRFIDIASRGTLPVPLKYYGARTGRWAADGSINLQNLPRGSVLKNAIMAPEGHVVVDCDSSQIEARMLAWWAEQEDLVAAFARNEDVYRIMASSIYSKPEVEINKDERFVGKMTVLGCIAEGTLVLCSSGWKPIQEVALEDKLWDGEEWVCHQGLLNKGIKETWNSCGVWLTPDHRVLCGTQWKEWQYLVHDESTRSQALDTAAASLPLWATYAGLEGACKHSSFGATAAQTSIGWTTTTSKPSRVRGVISALKNIRPKLVSCIGGIAAYFQMTNTASDYSTVFQAALGGATTPRPKRTPTMGGGGFSCTPHGAKTVSNFLATCLLWIIGTTPAAISTALTTTRGMNPGTSGLPRALKMQGTNGRSKSYSQNLMTYDIAYAGPRNRYTIATDAGPIIVHNCGYGMGHAKFRMQLKNFGVELEEAECERIIRVYRSTYPMIPELWAQAQEALAAMLNDQTAPLGRDGVVVVEGRKGIRLPNGLYIKYPNLRWVKDDNGKREMVYDTKKGRTTVPNRIYGGKVVENVTQALARIAVGEQMLRVAKKYKVAMTVHDAVAAVVPEYEGDNALEYVELCMRIRPTWAPDLPLNCEGGVHKRYGQC